MKFVQLRLESKPLIIVTDCTNEWDSRDLVGNEDKIDRKVNAFNGKETRQYYAEHWDTSDAKKIQMNNAINNAKATYGRWMVKKCRASIKIFHGLGYYFWNSQLQKKTLNEGGKVLFVIYIESNEFSRRTWTRLANNINYFVQEELTREGNWVISQLAGIFRVPRLGLNSEGNGGITHSYRHLSVLECIRNERLDELKPKMLILNASENTTRKMSTNKLDK